MTRFLKIIAVLALAIGFTGQAKANSWALTKAATSQEVYATVGTWANAVSSSVTGLQNTAADATSVLYFDITPPWSEGVVLRQVRVTYKQIIAAADAVPSFVIRKVVRSNFGQGTTITSSALTETEGTCGLTKDTTYNCAITLSSPVQVKAGETYQLEMTTNQSATGVMFIDSYQIRGSGY